VQAGRIRIYEQQNHYPFSYYGLYVRINIIRCSLKDQHLPKILKKIHFLQPFQYFAETGFFYNLAIICNDKLQKLI
jgi:hypothetical protein